LETTADHARAGRMRRIAEKGRNRSTPREKANDETDEATREEHKKAQLHKKNTATHRKQTFGRFAPIAATKTREKKKKTSTTVVRFAVASCFGVVFFVHHVSTVADNVLGGLD
jgi:hypothetical protein